MFALIVGFLVTFGRSFALQESVGAVPAVGWAVLATGIAVAASRGWRVGVASSALAAAALAILYGAHHRKRGWPGVAGWEFSGMQSPVVLSASVAVLSAASSGRYSTTDANPCASSESSTRHEAPSSPGQGTLCKETGSSRVNMPAATTRSMTAGPSGK